MAQIILGKTGLKIEKNGFGALPIQRASFDETKEIVQEITPIPVEADDRKKSEENKEDSVETEESFTI